MNNHQIASLGCKFLGIYALLKSIPLFGTIFQMYAFAKDEPAFGKAVILITTVPFILMVTSAIILILFSNKFASKMIDIKSNENSIQTVSSRDIQSIAFSIIGLVLFLLALPKLTQIGWNIYAIKASGDERNISEILRNTWSFAIATGVQFIIGITLFIGSELLATLWHNAVKHLRYERNIP